MKKLRVNTSNPGKREEFTLFFQKFSPETEIVFTTEDLEEPLADHLTVVAYKASQCILSIIEDTALEVEGEDVGPNVKFTDLLPLVGKRARWISRIGSLQYIESEKLYKVKVFKGELSGVLVPPKGSSGHGFDALFLPEMCDETLAQTGDRDVEELIRMKPRYRAMKNYIEGCIETMVDPIPQWDGSFQE